MNGLAQILYILPFQFPMSSQSLSFSYSSPRAQPCHGVRHRRFFFQVEAASAVIEATTKPLNKESSDDLETQMKVLNLESQNKESEEVECFDSSDSYDSEEEGTFIYPQPQPQPPRPDQGHSCEELFKEAGEVVAVRFAMTKDDGSFKGFGHVEFASSEEAEKALEFHRKPLLGRDIILGLAIGSRGVNTPQSGNNTCGNFRSGGGGSSVDGDGNAPPTIPPSNL